MSSPASRRYLDRPRTPLLIILSGPSGAGKDAVLARMKELGCPLKYIVTLTTRPRRPTETDGVHYRFVSVTDFQRLADAGELLEVASVYGNWYGTPRQDVHQGLAAGEDTIVKVDVQGAASIRKLAPHAVLIFLTPPSVEELMDRLRQRRTESTFDLALRLKTAEAEYDRVPMFDYLVFNPHEEIDRAVADITAIIAAEKSRVAPRVVSL
jgi:guanylate kinase